MNCRQSRWIVRGFAAALSLCIIAPPGVARADSELGMKALSFVAPGLGGYWFTSGSADRALGSPKFVGGTTFWVKPAHRGGYEITGGFQEISIKDHWQPFSGGNKVSLMGGAVRITRTREHRDDLVPLVNVGLYYGEIDSDRLNMSANRIVPSIAVGLEKEVIRYVRLGVGYRWTEKIGGVDTSGAYLRLSLFP